MKYMNNKAHAVMNNNNNNINRQMIIMIITIIRPIVTYLLETEN